MKAAPTPSSPSPSNPTTSDPPSCRYWSDLNRDWGDKPGQRLRNLVSDAFGAGPVDDLPPVVSPR